MLVFPTILLVNPNVSGGEPTDPYYSNVAFLSHFNTSPFVDEKEHTITSNGSNITLSTSDSKYGGGAISFNGSGYLIVSNPTDFRLGSNNFTIECWVKPATLTTQIITSVLSLSTGDYGFTLQMNDDSGNILGAIYASNGASFAIATENIDINTAAFHHIAYVRSGNIFYIFFNGILKASDTSSITGKDTTSSLAIGSSSDGQFNFNGEIDDLRITKGIARYTANFTPPVSQFPDS